MSEGASGVVGGNDLECSRLDAHRRREAFADVLLRVEQSAGRAHDYVTGVEMKDLAGDAQGTDLPQK